MELSSPRGGSHVVSTLPGAHTSPIDVEALEDEVHAISPSQVPPPRRNRRTRRQTVTIIDLEIEVRHEGNKRPRIGAAIQLSIERGEGSNLQSNDVLIPCEEAAKVAPKEPNFTCPVCLDKLKDPSTTICGHIFCTECIKQCMQFKKKCPTCRRYLPKNNFHRIYLPSTDGSGHKSS